MYCQNCGAQLPDSATYCDKCGNRVGLSDGGGTGTVNRSMASIMVNKKSEALALILSLIIPGLGQIYIGKTWRGIRFIIAILIIALIVTWLAGILIAGIVGLALWLYSMYDAYTGAKEYNRYLLDHNGQPPW